MRNKKHCARERSGNLIETIGRNLDLPQDAFSGYAHIELCGNREAIVEGCMGILEYNDSSVAVNTGKLTVRFCGSGLTISSMQESATVIKGIFTCIDFSN